MLQDCRAWRQQHMDGGWVLKNWKSHHHRTLWRYDIAEASAAPARTSSFHYHQLSLQCENYVNKGSAKLTLKTKQINKNKTNKKRPELEANLCGHNIKCYNRIQVFVFENHHKFRACLCAKVIVMTTWLSQLGRKVFGKRFLPLGEVEGLPLPPVQLSMVTWKKQIDYIRELELRDDDVILCAYPKAGKSGKSCFSPHWRDPHLLSSPFVCMVEGYGHVGCSWLISV